MRNIKLVLAYDGTDFDGWQRQPMGRTVQEVVEKALAKMHKHPVHIHAAGRTDAGVHATGQCINFITDIDSIPVEKIAVACNSFLPRDVRAVSADCVDENFHARYSATAREYRFYVFPSSVPYPHMRRFSLWIPWVPSLDLLNAYAMRIIGENDFTSFAAPSDQSPSRIRHIFSSFWYTEGSLLVYKIIGSSFLWKMVRCLVGTMLELAKKQAHPDMMKEILLARDRSLAADTAPPQGLFLHRVYYGKEYKI
ncbi:tRNA pseudouridine(38-40) synthase TruA [Spirochaetia bacterium 38H-sp]|uniref:tRNA pseudouridine synthase A n=1 Tax=Rarispira pelagica TaxID=3141764 RepID=A0ABU9UEA8_9SPIR